MTQDKQAGRYSLAKWVGLAGGPIVALIVVAIMPESYQAPSGETVLIDGAMRAIAALAVWMAVWWLTEAIPVYATALLPIALFPLTGATTIKAAAAPYGHELIYLFLGGFVMALAMERWGLHRRIAFAALRLTGTRPHSIVGGFMFVTAMLSMWVTNTATTIMMLPIALSVIDLVAADGEKDDRHKFALSLLLGTAYAASIGGIGTLIGTVPNGIAASFAAERLGVEISFFDWMKIGVPLVCVFLPCLWLLFTRVFFKLHTSNIQGSEEVIRKAYHDLGPMSRGEKITLTVFLLTAFAWIFRRFLNDIELLSGLTDPGIAVISALLLFVIPVDAGKRVFAMDWETAVKLPWGILILFGGGLSLASAVDGTGVSSFLGSLAGGLAGLPTILVIAAVIAMIIFLTELTSNTATTATLLPVLAALAPVLDVDPLILVLPAAIAASCAFMLPVATPPNAIVFSSGLIHIPEMSRTGLWLNILGIFLIIALSYWVILPVFAA